MKQYRPLELELDDIEDLELQSLSLLHKKPRERPVRSPTYSASRVLTGPEYTNISCRFVLRPGALDPWSVNVDKPIDRKSILRVFAPPQECPICLDRVVAGRMLGCGHILCLVCLVNHRHYSERPACPVCTDFVSLDPLAALPVSLLDVDQRFLPQVGHETVLTLMRREQGSTVALPANLAYETSVSGLPDPSTLLWSRLAEGSPEWCASEFDQEYKALSNARKEALDEGDGDDGYADALAAVRKQKSAILSPDTSPKPHNSTPDTPRGQPHTGTDFYFYQTGYEGTAVFTLSPLDISVLRAAFGDYHQFPTSLVVRIEHMTQASLVGDLRRRMKYLNHLPEHTPLVLLECDWKNAEIGIPPAVLKRFRKQLTDRRKKRHSREVREDRDKQFAEQALDAQFRSELVAVPEPQSLGLEGIDASTLPSLPQTRPQPEAKEIESRKWIDQQKDYDDLMKNAYVPKKGRKKIILHST